MKFPRSLRNHFIWLSSVLLFVVCTRVLADDVILHLRNGDHVAGHILSESSDLIIISNTWSKELNVPLKEVERRETLPAPASAFASTNALPKEHGTNILTQMKVVPALADTNSYWKRWKGEISVGMELEKGAIEHELYYGRAKLTYAQAYVKDPKQFFRNIFTYDAEYGKTDGTFSDNRMSLSSKTDLDLTRNYYLYNLGAAGYDHVSLINLHYEEGPGVGYHWVNQTNLAVNLELGANYQVNEQADDTTLQSFYYRLGQDLTWKLNSHVTLTEKYEYFPKANYATQFRMRFESTLSCALLLNLSWNFSVIDFYDTEPAGSVPNNDLQLRSSLGIKF